LPRSLTVKLYIPNLGHNVSHAGYASRHELLFAFIRELLLARVKDNAIIGSCLDVRYRGMAIFEHCREKGGRSYVKRGSPQDDVDRRLLAQPRAAATI
jgi:hypothetical protein